jgi:signal transduction histidine kinase
MAVEHDKKPVLMRDYLSQFHKRSAMTVVGVIVSASACVTLLLSVSGLMVLWSVAFWATLVIIATTFSALSLWMFWKLSRPFRDIVSEVIVIGGEPTVITPPNPNTKHYEEDGFKQILQTIYELAVKHNQPVLAAPDPDEPLHTGLDQTPTGIVILDKEGRTIYSNKNAPIRINSEGEKALDLLFPSSETFEEWLAACEKKSVHAERIWTRLSDKPPGERGRRIYDLVASYQKNSTAETVLTFFDRTETYAPEEDDLDFISFAAHELRGPITVIRGYLDVLEDELQPVLENDQAELLQRLIVSSNRLSSYVNNILNASRYDRRHFKVHLGEERLVDIYDAIKDDMQLRALSQNRMLTIDLSDNLPTVAADKNSIGEVMSNLIDNAIKYSNEGGQVIVKARTISGFVEVSVVDRGIGMPSNVIPNLFHKFYRSHRSRETVAGTGIGLYISKAIVESHGGFIEVRSTEREGSTFTFTLPIYDTVADKIKAGNDSNQLLIQRSGGWIRNHSMYRG